MRPVYHNLELSKEQPEKQKSLGWQTPSTKQAEHQPPSLSESDDQSNSLEAQDNDCQSLATLSGNKRRVAL